jgi:hypothetical protein
MFRALGPRGISIPTPMLPMVSQTNDVGDAVGVRGPAITGGIASPSKQAVPLSPLDLPLSVSPPPYTDLASTDPNSRAYRDALAPLSWIRHEADVQFNIISSAQREQEEAEEEEAELEAGGKGKGRDGVDELDYYSGTVAPVLLPDILDDTLDDKDFEYAIQLQIEELQRVAHEFEDEKMARRLAGESVAMQEDHPSPRYNLRSRPGVESVVAMQEDPSPRYNLRPRPSRAGTVSNATAGPSSRSATTTRNSIKKKT